MAPSLSHTRRDQQHPPLPLFSRFLFRFTELICSAVGSAPDVYAGSARPWPKAGPPGVFLAPPTRGMLIYFSLISLVIVSKAMSTLWVSLADVSKKGMPNWLANSCPSSKETYLRSSMSHLLPTKILHTPACEYFSISLIQVRTLSNVSLSVTS